jgi:Ca-activated chloride channel family protein
MVSRADLRVDVPLVLIPVHVSTRSGRPVTDLKQENFRLFENNVEQKITNFANEDAPVSIGLLFDMSGSMRDKLRKASESAIQFLKTANIEDEFFLIEFNDKPKLAMPFTRDPDDIQQELARARPHGQTALLDAIGMALKQMKSARHIQKALIIVSDGGDNHSRSSEAEIHEAMLEADVQVYAMGIFDPSGTHGRSREQRDGPRLLNDVAEETGGRHFPVQTVDQLPDVCAQIGQALRNQYLLAYAPANSERDGKFRRIKVVLNNVPEGKAGLRVRSRIGYHAPYE